MRHQRGHNTHEQVQLRFLARPYSSDSERQWYVERWWGEKSNQQFAKKHHDSPRSRYVAVRPPSALYGDEHGSHAFRSKSHQLRSNHRRQRFRLARHDKIGSAPMPDRDRPLWLRLIRRPKAATMGNLGLSAPTENKAQHWTVHLGIPARVSI